MNCKHSCFCTTHQFRSLSLSLDMHTRCIQVRSKLLPSVITLPSGQVYTRKKFSLIEHRQIYEKKKIYARKNDMRKQDLQLSPIFSSPNLFRSRSYQCSTKLLFLAFILIDELYKMNDDFDQSKQGPTKNQTRPEWTVTTLDGSLVPQLHDDIVLHCLHFAKFKWFFVFPPC